MLAGWLTAWGDPGPTRASAPPRERYVGLKDVASAYRLALRGPRDGRLELVRQDTRLAFETEGRPFRYNDLLLWLNVPITASRGRWMMAEADYQKVIQPLLNRAPALRGQRCRVIVLDPGHGGQDRGARGARGVEEKGVVLDIARRARVHLANAGFKVYLTRDGDRFVPLDERVRKAAEWQADLFISIHLNAAASQTAKGLETYTLALPGYPPTSAESDTALARVAYPGNRFDIVNGLLGYYLHKALVDKLRPEDRGLRRSRFVVLREAPCPAVLVECGFLSCAEEEARMLDSAHREAVGLALAKGLLDFNAAILQAQAEK